MQYILRGHECGSLTHSCLDISLNDLMVAPSGWSQGITKVMTVQICTVFVYKYVAGQATNKNVSLHLSRRTLCAMCPK